MNLISVKDINAPELDIFAKYTEPQLRGCFAPDFGLFLAETGSVILRALEAGYEPVSMLVETERLEAEARPVFEAVEKHCGKNVIDTLPVYVADREIVVNIIGYHLVRGLWMALRRKPEIAADTDPDESKYNALPIDFEALAASIVAFSMIHFFMKYVGSHYIQDIITSTERLMIFVVIFFALCVVQVCSFCVERTVRTGGCADVSG